MERSISGECQWKARVRPELKLVTHLRESGRRISVWIVVIACHLGLLMLFLQPASDESDMKPLAKDRERVLLLRLLSLPRSSALTPPTRRVSGGPRHQDAASKPRMTIPSVQLPMRPIKAPSAEAHMSSPETTPAEAANSAGAKGDGGFGQRLREAQHASDSEGVPGSDKALVSGIHFVDPMDQGIGAVARQTQRLFGIKSRQCLDVEKWRSMTPQELSARHISPDDVDREDEKYQCNAPPGLHF